MDQSTKEPTPLQYTNGIPLGLPFRATNDHPPNQLGFDAEQQKSSQIEKFQINFDFVEDLKKSI